MHQEDPVKTKIHQTKQKGKRKNIEFNLFLFLFFKIYNKKNAYRDKDVIKGS